jgi:hypothetical protein
MDIFRRTNQKREQEAGLSSPQEKKSPSPPAQTMSQTEFTKPFTPEERAAQKARLAKLLTERK